MCGPTTPSEDRPLPCLYLLHLETLTPEPCRAIALEQNKFKTSPFAISWKNAFPKPPACGDACCNDWTWFKEESGGVPA